MQKLCGCPELGLFKEQKKTSGWKGAVAKGGKQGPGREDPPAAGESLRFLGNGTGSLWKVFTEKVTWYHLPERSSCHHRKGVD